MAYYLAVHVAALIFIPIVFSFTRKHRILMAKRTRLASWVQIAETKDHLQSLRRVLGLVFIVFIVLTMTVIVEADFFSAGRSARLSPLFISLIALSILSVWPLMKTSEHG